EYIETPPDLTGAFTGGTVATQATYSSPMPTDTTYTTATFNNVDLTGGQTNPMFYAVLPGDFFVDVSASTPVLHLIVGVNGATGANPRPGGGLPQYIRVADRSVPPGSGTAANGTLPPAVQRTSWRIVRGPRPASGEPTQKLPRDVAIDLARSSAADPN